MIVRPFTPADVPGVWGMMRDLAVFEGYSDRFRVTPQDVLTHGFGPQPRFGVLVAERQKHLCGMAVHYTIPWTFDLRPVVVLKELFVQPAARGQGVGQALVRGLAEHAASLGASALRWTVLPDNAPAQALYAGLGGQKDPDWDHWVLAL